MDPNACLERIADADTRQEQREACEDLSTWLKGGGFEPDWSSSKRGTLIYNSWFNGGF